MRSRTSLQINARRRRLAALAAAVALCSTVPQAPAATLYWDPGLTNSTTGGGNGTWDLGAANWYNGTADIAWTDTTGTVDIASFGGAAGSVNLAAALGARGLVFSTSGYSIGGSNVLTLGDAGINLASLNSGTTTIGASVALGASQNWSVGAGATLDVSGAITGAEPLVLQQLGGGTLNLTSASNSFGRLAVNGGTVSLGTTGAAPTSVLTVNTGEFIASGDAAGARTLSVATLTPNTAAQGGHGTLTLIANAAQPLTLTAGALGTRTYGSTQLYRGTNLGSTPGAGVASIFFTAAPTVSTIGETASFAALSGVAGSGTTQAAVLRGALADGSATGTGSGFATYDPAVGVRVLNRTTEQVTGYAAAVANDNVRLSGTQSITGKQTNTLHVENTGGTGITITNSGTALQPSNGLLFTGTGAIALNGGSLTFAPSAVADLPILSTNTAGVTIGTNLANGGSVKRGFTFGGSGDITLTGTIATAGGGGIIVNGPGSVAFSGSTFSLSSAGMTVNGGTAKLSTATNLGTSSTFSGTRAWRVGRGGTLDFNGANIVPTSVTTNTIDFLEDTASGGGTITNTHASNASTVTITGATTATGSRTFSGVIAGNINLVRALRTDGATNNSTLAQVLAGNSTYTGSTTINGGNLTLGTHNALPATTTLNVNSSTSAVTPSSLDLAGFNQTVAVLGGATAANGAFVQNGAVGTTSTLTVNGSGNSTFSNIIRDNAGTGGTVAVVKGGAGTLTLSGANAYSGGTTINGGTLVANGGSPTGSGAVIINAGGALAGTGTVGGSVTANNGALLAPGGTTIGTLTVAGLNLSAGTHTLNYEINSTNGGDKLAVTGADALVLGLAAGANTVNLASDGSGPVQPGKYVLIDYEGAALAGIGQFTLGSLPQRVTAGAGLKHDTANTNIYVDLTADAPKWVGNQSDDWDVNLSENWKLIAAGTPTKYLAGDFVTFDGTAASGAVELTAVVSPGGVVVNNPAALPYTFSGGGAIAGSTGLTKQGNGSLTIANTAANTFTGPTQIEGGTLVLAGSLANTSAVSVTWGATLQIGAGGATGSIGSGTLSNNGTVNVNRTGTATIAGAISGAGALNVTGGGTLVLSGNNAGYTGPISVTGSGLQLAAAGAGSIGNLTLTDAAISATTSTTLGQSGGTAPTQSTATVSGNILLDSGAGTLTVNHNLVGGATITRNAGSGTLAFLGATATGTTYTNALFTGSFTNTVGNVTFTRNSGSADAAWNFNGGSVTLTAIGGTISFGSLSGTAGIGNASASSSARLRIGDLDTDSTYAGVIGTANPGRIAIRKVGTGTLTLSAQNLYTNNEAVTGLVGYQTVIAQGGIAVAASNVGTASGPVGPSANVVLVGGNDMTLDETAGTATTNMVDANLRTAGGVTLSNPITVSGGGFNTEGYNNVAQTAPYTLGIGGGTDNNSTFAGAVTLQNNLTVTQVATTGSNALHVTGNIAGTAAGTGAGTLQSVLNNGTQTVTFAGPGAINVSGAIVNGDGTVKVASAGGTTTLNGANTYTGGTTLTGGTLSVGSDANLGAAAGPVTFNGGTLQVTGSA
ncbi:MAG TPA: autotransporter-associated beta strand repeat-containing protein, partial [Tepidisphaeraceae bacterium]|nr:autotransporter-associated beta strand repeat-containing protein [Tepidisphaeraceae bacterium]